VLGYITLLLVCQLAGEVAVRLTGLPIPGPVVGMAILFAGLVVRGGIPSGLDGVAGALLRHLSLLFVPAGVGVMLHVRLIAEEWLPLTAALVVSTIATIAITGRVMHALLRPRAEDAA
jgi:holin-like protein